MLPYKTLVALTIAVAAPAVAAPQMQYGEAEGEQFVFTSELQDKGVIHLAGVIRGSRERFALDVYRNGLVVGRFGDTAVEYDIPRTLRDHVAHDLGERPAITETAAR